MENCLPQEMNKTLQKMEHLANWARTGDGGSFNFGKSSKHHSYY